MSFQKEPKYVENHIQLEETDDGTFIFYEDNAGAAWITSKQTTDLIKLR